jgi:colanic acid biosynthesis glycosyl transferase WcaI
VLLVAAIVAFVNESSLRITIVGLNYAPETTGNAPYTASLAEGLAARGHKVHVVAGYPHYPEWQVREGYTGWSRLETIHGVDVHRVRHFVPRRPNLFTRLLMEVSFGVRALLAPWSAPDVILLVSPALFSCGIVGLRARWSRKRPLMAIWVQDLYSRGVLETNAGGSGAAGIVAKVESAILSSADGVVVIHDRFRDYVNSVLKVSADKTRVIRNWTHLPVAPASNSREMRHRLGWSQDDVVVLHAGNMGRKQGLENVLDAARIAEERGSRVLFVLMGDGNQREALERQSEGLSRLRFIDPLPGGDFQQALAAADVLLVNELPGVREMAVPSKLTSYFSAGKAVIAATDSGSVTAAEIAASGGGVRVDPARPGALVEAAEMLGNDKDKAKMLGAHGLRYRQDTLSEAAALDHYDGFITDLASSHGL